MEADLDGAVALNAPRPYQAGSHIGWQGNVFSVDGGVVYDSEAGPELARVFSERSD